MAESNLSLHGQISSFSPAEVVSWMSRLGKTGRLDVQDDKGRRSLFFQRGEIVFASSTFKEERLGECLMRAGRLTPEQFSSASNRMKPGARFGAILVEMKFLNASQLWTGVKNQVEEIFSMILRLRKGDFSFAEGPLQLTSYVRLSRTVQEAILSSVSNQEELTIFSEKIVSPSTVFLALAGRDVVQLGDLERQLLPLVNGKRSVAALIQKSPWTPLVTMKLLSNLMAARMIMPSDLLGTESAGASKHNSSPEILTREQHLVQIRRYEAMFLSLEETLRQRGKLLQADLEEYILENSDAGLLWQGVEWREGTGFDRERIFANLKSLSGGGEFLAQQMEDLSCYLLFKAEGVVSIEDLRRLQSLFRGEGAV